MKAVRERAPGRDGTHVVARLNPKDAIHWAARVAREAWDPDQTAYALRKKTDELLARYGVASPQFISSAVLRGLKLDPDLVVVEGNLLVNQGIQRLEDLWLAAGGTALNNANAFLGVGDTSTAATASDTDLGAAAGSTHRFFRAMNATYPSRSGQVVTLQSDFPGTDAAFHWQEWGCSIGTSSASGDGFTVPTLLSNHKITDLGTKPGTSATWTLTATITIS